MKSLSQTQLWLYETVTKNSAMSRDEFSVLIQTVMAPENLQSFFLILEDLPETLNITSDICHLCDYEDFLKNNISPSLRASEIIQKNRDAVEDNLLLSRLKPTSVNQTDDLKGIIESCPLYSILGHSIQTPALSKKYLHLKAQTLLALNILSNNYPNQIDKLLTAYRGIRYLSLPKYQRQLEIIPSQATMPRKFLDSMNSAAQNSRLADARILLEHSLEGFKKRTRPNTNKTASKSKKTPPSTSSEARNKVEHWTGIEISVQSSLSQDEVRKFEDFGGKSAEFQNPQDAVPVIASSERTYTRSTLRELAFTAKQTSNRIATRNQYSPFAWHELNQQDIATLLDFLTQDTPESDLHIRHQQLSLVKITLNLMFWCSCSLERALVLKISPDRYPGINASESIYWIKGKAPYLRLFTPGPILKEESKDRYYPQAHPVGYSVSIPLCNIASEIVKNKLKLNALPIHAKEVSIFPTDQDEANTIQSDVRKSLKYLNKKFGTRLTSTNISNHLLYHLSRWPGEDLPSAMLFFGRNNEATTRMHYTFAPLQRVEKSYIHMCIKYSAEIGHEICFPDSECANDNKSAAGTPWCPTSESIRNLVWELQQDIQMSMPTSSSDLEILEVFHNHLTLYTALLIAFSSGYRAIRSPSIEYEEIHHDSDYLIISDKDDDRHYSTRRVCLPKVCLQQIENYRNHLIAVWDKFGSTSKPLFELFKKNSGYRFPLELFYIDFDLMDSYPFRPGLTKELLQNLYGYELPPNANRHFLKYHLLKKGCEQEIIEAFLGHSEIGQEPWSNISNLHPFTFKDRIAPHLESILEEHGWVAVEGFRL